MRNKTLVELYRDIELAALDSGLVEEVVIVKDEDELVDLIEDLEYRTLFLVIEAADIMTEDDTVQFFAVVLDKTGYNNNDEFLYSVNDGVALLKELYDYLNYANYNDIEVGTVDIGSAVNEGTLMTSVSANIMFHVTYLPNIKKIYTA